MFSIIPDGAHFREFALLKDGQGILLRIASPADVDRVEAFMHGLSRETLSMRFMGGVSSVSRKFVEELCEENPHERACLLAIEGMEAGQRVVGLGNYVGMRAGIAEVSFVVADDHQGRGISSLILERLAGLAAGSGYVGFEADVLYENEKMINVFRDSGFETQRAMEGGIIHLQFPLSAAQTQRERAEIRERVAAANSLVPLLKPATVAVVGASRDPSSIGNAIFRHILQSHFKGVVYPVNP
jgi:RimJ/RimL family protein N-acetyltransferase